MKTLMVIVMVLMGSMVYAQTPVPSPTPVSTKLAWDHDGANVDGFRLFERVGPTDSQLGGDIAATLREVTFPALTPGIHTLLVKAFNIAGNSEASNLLEVRVVVVPLAPSNFRLIAMYDKDWNFINMRVSA